MEASRVPPSKAKQRKQSPHQNRMTLPEPTTEKPKSMTWAQKLKRVLR